MIKHIEQKKLDKLTENVGFCYYVTLLIPIKSPKLGFEQIGLFSNPLVNSGISSFGKGTRNNNVTLAEEDRRWHMPAEMNTLVGRNGNRWLWYWVAKITNFLIVSTVANQNVHP